MEVSSPGIDGVSEGSGVGSGVGTGGVVGSTGSGVLSIGAVEGGWGLTVSEGVLEHPDRLKTIRQVSIKVSAATEFILCLVFFIVRLLSYDFYRLYYSNTASGKYQQRRYAFVNLERFAHRVADRGPFPHYRVL